MRKINNAAIQAMQAKPFTDHATVCLTMHQAVIEVCYVLGGGFVSLLPPLTDLVQCKAVKDYFGDAGHVSNIRPLPSAFGEGPAYLVQFSQASEALAATDQTVRLHKYQWHGYHLRLQGHSIQLWFISC